jgi:hypothetical protein
MLDAGGNFEKSYVLPPRSRVTVDVFSVVAGDRDVSLTELLLPNDWAI